MEFSNACWRRRQLKLFKSIKLVILAIAMFFLQTGSLGPSIAPLSFDQTSFTPGINYPWNNYSRDFGESAWGHVGVSEPKEFSRVDADFQKMHDSGVQITRWFVFANGISGIKTAADGTPIGLDDQVFKDFDAAVSIARHRKVYVIFVFFDYLLFDKGSRQGDVQAGGRRDWIVDTRQRKALVDNVVAPLVARYGKEPIVAAWEVVNEPEWVMKLNLKGQSQQVKIAEMQQFVREIAQTIHALSNRPVTIGSASPRYLKYWYKVGLDLYQYHYYPNLEGRLYPSVLYSRALMKLDKPLILGEFPTDAPLTQTEAYLNGALANGCAGALGWSMRATDQYSNAQKGLGPLKNWSSRHLLPITPAVP